METVEVTTTPGFLSKARLFQVFGKTELSFGRSLLIDLVNDRLIFKRYNKKKLSVFPVHLFVQLLSKLFEKIPPYLDTDASCNERELKNKVRAMNNEKIDVMCSCDRCAETEILSARISASYQQQRIFWSVDIIDKKHENPIFFKNDSNLTQLWMGLMKKEMLDTQVIACSRKLSTLTPLPEEEVMEPEPEDA